MEKLKKCQASTLFMSCTMHSKGNLNTSYTFHFKATRMREYNRNLRNPNKKTPRGSKFIIHAQIIKEGAWGLKGWGTIITPEELT